jgi:hypothetical protein
MSFKKHYLHQCVCLKLTEYRLIELVQQRWPFAGLWHHRDWQKFTNASEVLAAAIIRAMRTTQCYNPEDCHFHTHCHENLKSYSTAPAFPE